MNAVRCIVKGLFCVVTALSARADLYVSENGADTNPGTEGAPFRTVQAAVDAAPQEGCVIHVDAGSYPAKSGATPVAVVNVTKPVAIIGAGAGQTVITGKGISGETTCKNVVRMTCDGASLSGVTLTGLTYNNQKEFGIGLYLTAGEVSNVIIEKNAGYATPGAYVNGGKLFDSIIRNNTMNSSVDGIGLRLNKGEVVRCEIYGQGKDARHNMCGGGVYQTGGILRECKIHNNVFLAMTTGYYQNGTDSCNASGAGLWMSGGTATCCRVYNNVCGGHAAGVKVSGTAVLEDSFVYGNVMTNLYVSTEGSGVNVNGAKAIVQRCVIANNRALRGAEGLALVNGTVSNCWIYANGISNYTATAGTFADNSFFNPGIAELESAVLPAEDAFSCSFASDRTFIRGNDGGEVTFTASAKNAPGAVTYTWTFDDGGTAEGAEVSHAFKPGYHMVTLTAAAGNETAVCRTKDAVVVLPQKVYVSKAGVPKYPYTTPETAAAEIDDVTGLFPLEIDVGTGSYGLKYHGLFFFHPVKLTGAGYDKTIVDGSKAGYSRGVILDHPDAVVSGVRFYNNNLKTWDIGAGALIYHGTVSNCWIRKAGGYNHIGANLFGGKLVDSLVTECDNGSSQRGLGVSLRGGSMYGCVVSNNTTTGTMNGIVYVSSGSSIASNCVICANQSGSTTQNSLGGGLWIENGLVTHCRVVGNKATKTGGGAYMTGGTLRNSLVTGNSTLDSSGSPGGGVYNNGGTVENCTIVGNTATGAGDGLYQKKGTTVNTIVYGNAVDNLVVESGSVTDSCMNPVVDGEGNTSVAPAFVAQADGNYHLTSLASAQIDAGETRPWMTETAGDLDGNPRVVNGKPDMGCYEYAPSEDEPFIAQFTATGTSGKAPVDASFEAIVSKYPVGECTFLWYFGDSETPVAIEGEATATHRYETSGTFTVRLVVQHGGESAPAEYDIPSCVSVVPEVCYVSKTGSNTPPYDTMGKAATSFAAAFAVGSDKIVVSNGTYTTPSFTVGRKLEIVSLNGPSVTTLKPSATGAPFILIGDDDAILAGFTVSGGKTQDHSEALGGSAVRVTAGLVTNCVIRDSSQYQYGSLLAKGTGRVFDCEITKNSAPANAGNAGGFYLAGSAVMSGCRIHGNTSSCKNADALGGAGGWVAGGTLTNCVIWGNSEDCQNSKAALYVSGGLVTHCVITNNEIFSLAGGVRQTGGTIRNSLIAGNKTTSTTAGDGVGGLLIEGGVAESLTIVGNSAALGGGGVRQKGGVLLNTIVYGNVSLEECELSGGVRSNCFSTVAMDGTDCLGGDPLFADAAHGDYRLSVLSAARESGLNQDWMSGATDLAGFTRLSGDTVDIGAYESDASVRVPFAAGFASTASERLDNEDTRITFAATVVGNEGAVTYCWDFGDGSEVVETTEAQVVHEFSPGAYTVKVRAFDAGTQEYCDWSERADYAVAVPRVCYVAKGEGVTPRYPYVTPAEGASSLAEALAAGSEEVCILPGTYTIAETINVSRDVVIYSQSGSPTDTVISGSRSTELRLMSIASEGAVLRGVTLRGGRSTQGDNGATLKLAGGTVEDCILERGYVYNYGAVSVSGGTLRRCILRGHENYSSGDSEALRLTKGLVDCCVITNNSHVGNAGEPSAAVHVSGANSHLRNTLIAFNRGKAAGGLSIGASVAEVANCTIVSNTASEANGGVKAGSSVPTLCCNNIICDNVAPTNPEMADSIVTYFTYSCSPALNRGAGNIAADPLFETRRSRPLFSLSRRSPCIDRGSWSALGETKDAVRAQTDLRGAARLCGPEVDIGCYECPLKGFTLLVR